MERPTCPSSSSRNNNSCQTRSSEKVSFSGFYKANELLILRCSIPVLLSIFIPICLYLGLRSSVKVPALQMRAVTDIAYNQFIETSINNRREELQKLPEFVVTTDTRNILENKFKERMEKTEEEKQRVEELKRRGKEAALRRNLGRQTTVLGESNANNSSSQHDNFHPGDDTATTDRVEDDNSSDDIGGLELDKAQSSLAVEHKSLDLSHFMPNYADYELNELYSDQALYLLDAISNPDNFKSFTSAEKLQELHLFIDAFIPENILHRDDVIKNMEETLWQNLDMLLNSTTATRKDREMIYGYILSTFQLIQRNEQDV